ncbi:MAG TPA: glucosidase, partial [Blastocatellia bacterium]|nr:glucosidase [Blastocatellia bacterium]
RSNFEWFIKNRKDIVQECCHRISRNGEDVYVLAIVDEEQTRSLLERIINPDEFLSDFGIRSLSKYHEQHPFVFAGKEVRYEPAETDNKIKGGNSNWRGPVWFPTTFLLIESLRKLGTAYGEDFSVPLPDGSGQRVTLVEMAGEIANRLISIFARNESGRRPVYGGSKKFQDDPHWRDYILFYEYFHGDNGAGIGASHQTGWTALVASLIDEWRM